MITLQITNLSEYLALREQFPPEWFQSIPSPSAGNPAPRPVKAGAKGECEKQYNVDHGIFRFTDEQKAIHDTFPTEKERAEFRELKCAECLATGKRNGWKEGDKVKVQEAQGESEQGGVYNGEEVEPDEGMF